MPLRVRSGLLLAVILALFLGAWQVAATPPAATGPAMDPEYAKLIGAAAQEGRQTPMPRPSDIAARAWHHLRDPFYVRGTNDQGLGNQLAWSLMRVTLGFGLAALLAIPLGFLIGMSPVLNGALDPIIQVLRPGQPARVDAAGALHDQGQRRVGDLRHLHLRDLADAAEHGVRRGVRPQGVAERGPHAGGRAVAHGGVGSSCPRRRRPS